VALKWLQKEISWSTLAPGKRQTFGPPKITERGFWAVKKFPLNYEAPPVVGRASWGTFIFSHNNHHWLFNLSGFFPDYYYFHFMR